MALNEFPVVPLTAENDEVVRVSKYSIIEARVINRGKTSEQNENWYIQVTTVMGKYHLLIYDGAPYADKATAITKRDEFLNDIG